MNRPFISIKSKILSLRESDQTKVALAQFYSKGVSFLIFLFISRDMEVSHYANFILIFAVISMITEIGNSGLLQGVLRYASQFREEKERQKAIISTSLLNGGLISLVLVFFLWLAKLFFVGPITSNILFYITATFLIFATFFSVCNTLFNAFGEYGKYWASIILNSTILAVFVLTSFVLLRLDTETILFCYAFSIFGAFLVQFLMLRKQIGREYDPNVTAATFGFGKWYLAWVIFSTLENKLDVFVLANIASRSDLATYDIASKFLQIIQLLFNAASVVLIPLVVAAKDNHEKINQARERIALTIKRLFFANTMLVVPISVFIHFYYDGNYDRSIIVYVIQSIAMYFFMRSLTYSAEIYRRNKPHIFLVVGIATTMIKFLCMLAIVGKLGAVGVALSMLASCIFSLFLYKAVLEFYRRRILRGEVQ